MSDIPKVYVTAKRSRDGTWGLTVESCPFCRKVHHHGGDSYETPVVGPRAAHCAMDALPRSYELVLSRRGA